MKTKKNILKKFKSIKLLLVLPLFIISSCGSKSNLINTNPYENKNIITGNVIEVTITDLRKDISNKEIKIPLLTFPGMKEEVSPILQENTIKVIKDEIVKQFSGNSDTSYNVEIKIVDGKVGFKASAFNEKEYTNVEIEIITTDQFKNTKNYKSNEYLEIKSIDASKAYLQKLFERGFINAIHKGFGENTK